MKKAFWTLFGDIVYQNICKNIDDSFVQCERCHKRFYRKRKDQIYCDKCTGYQKKGVKTLICCDCGKEFEICGVVKNKKRCDICQNKRDKENNLKRVKKCISKRN